MIKNIFLTLSLLASFAAGAAGVDQDVNQNVRRRTNEHPSILEIAASNEDFKTLATAVGIAGLEGALDCHWYYWHCPHLTVFAPTDDAFSDVPEDLLTTLTTDPQYHQHLTDLLLYHIAPGVIESKDINDGDTAPTLQGETLEAAVSASTGDISILDVAGAPDSNVVEPFDVKARNGIVHAIDSVLVPSFLTKTIYDVAEESGSFTKLLAAVDRVGLGDILKDTSAKYTLFAPSDDVFPDVSGFTDDQVTNILTYHVLSGVVPSKQLTEGSVTTVQGSDIVVKFQRFLFWFIGVAIDDSTDEDAHVTDVDILASNGIIHVIDKVLIPPSP